MSRQYPFKKKGSSGNSVLDKLGIQWGMNLTNRITNITTNKDTIAFNFDNLGTMFDQARNGIKHDIPISTSMKLFKHFTLSPSFNYQEWWYLEKLDRTFNNDLNEVEIDTIAGFNRANSYSFNAGLSTRVYGLYQIGGERTQAIRHVITPSLSFGYRPDFSQEKFDNYQEVQTSNVANSEGEFPTQFFSRYSGFEQGGPGLGESGTIGFSINNTLEAKVRSRVDSVQELQKVSILDNLSISTSYNFLADSFNLSNISLSARTKLFKKKLDMSANATINPYLYELLEPIGEDGVVSQRRVDQLAWQSASGLGEVKGKGIGQVSNATLRMGMSLNPKARGEDRNSNNATDEELEFINANPDLYVDWSIPWNLRFNYNITYSKIGFQESNLTQSLTLSGDVNLTEKWKVGFNSGYDFENKELTNTRFNVIRDLHCWEMRFDWTPFGAFESFSIDIHVKASVLQDLKLSRRRNFRDR